MFQNCVDLLRTIASYIGITYEEINIIIFCIIWPIITIYMGVIIIKQHLKLKNK